jgi:hypothetical protein
MISEIALIISSLGVGGLLGVFAKSILDRQQLRFSRVFEYKERRYQAMTILMLTAVNPSEYEWAQLRAQRPGINKIEDLDNELAAEYHNAMIFASDKVLQNLKVFLADKTLANYQAVAYAIRKDLYG